MKFQLERFALFSDAVFAIAITLMMIEIKPPHLEPGISFLGALEKFMELIPTFLGTILSFFLIGMFWRNHHELMKYMGSYNSKTIIYNLSFLLSIAFIPFSTSFMFENIESGSPFPLVVYNLNYIIAALMNYRLFVYILDPKNKLCNEHFNDDLSILKREMIYPVFVYVLVICLAFVNPNFAPIGYIGLAFENLFVKRKKVTAV